MKKMFLCLAIGLVFTSNCFGQSDPNIYPQWLIGTWVDDANNSSCTFKADGTHSGCSYGFVAGDPGDGTYVVIRDVIAFTYPRLKKTYSFNMFVSNDRKVAILVSNNSSHVIRKK